MLSKLAIAVCLMALCVVIHATGVTAAFTWMKGKSAATEGRFWLATGTLVCVAGWTVLMHLLQIAVWAFFYAWKHGMPDLQSAFYFSAVTYTTTGYGDLVLPKAWRLVGGGKALTGILMWGFSHSPVSPLFATPFDPNLVNPPHLLTHYTS